MMSVVLQATVQHLRSVLSWEKEQCDVQPNSMPPPSAGQWYVAVDDAGVDQRTAANGDLILEEIYTVEIAIWRRPNQLPEDRRKELLKLHSRYLLACETIESLERKVLWGMLGTTAGQLANRQKWRALANTLGGFPTAAGGDEIRMPLLYQGRSRNETMSIPGRSEGSSDEWFGRRLRFKGGDRIQQLEFVT